MKIDIYRSTTQPLDGLVVPAGTDPTTLLGEVGLKAANLYPLTSHSKGRTLGDIFKGSLLAKLEAELAVDGVGFVKGDVLVGGAARG